MKFLAIFVCSSGLWMWGNVSKTEAVSYLGCKQNYFYVKWRWGGHLLEESVARSAFQQALSDWNAAQDKRRFMNGGSSSTGVLDTYYDPNGDYGITHYYCSDDGSMTSWASKANVAVNQDYTPLRSTSNHELGHVLGLDHTSESPSIMNTSRNRWELITPQDLDVDGIENLY